MIVDKQMVNMSDVVIIQASAHIQMPRV